MENTFYKTDYCIFIPTDIKMHFREEWRFYAGKKGDQLWIKLIDTDTVGPVYTKQELLLTDAKPIKKVSLSLDIRAKTARTLLENRRKANIY